MQVCISKLIILDNSKPVLLVVACWRLICMQYFDKV